MSSRLPYRSPGDVLEDGHGDEAEHLFLAEHVLAQVGDRCRSDACEAGWRTPTWWSPRGRASIRAVYTGRPMLLFLDAGGTVAAAPRDVLVTVDDLPLASRAIHPDASGAHPHRARSAPRPGPAPHPGRRLREGERRRGGGGSRRCSICGSPPATSWGRTVTPISTTPATTSPSYLPTWSGRGRWRRSWRRGQGLRWFPLPLPAGGGHPEKLDAARSLARRARTAEPARDHRDAGLGLREPWVRAQAWRGSRAGRARRGGGHGLAAHQRAAGRARGGSPGRCVPAPGAAPPRQCPGRGDVGRPLFTWLEQTGHRFAPTPTPCSPIPSSAEPHR
jgi:hypothetical protein